MPRNLKILLICLSAVIVMGMLTALLQGNIAPKTRGIIKVSGFQDWQELGKYSYRQLYGRLVYVEQIQFGYSPAEEEKFQAFLDGFLKHAEKQNDSRWGLDKTGELGKRILTFPGGDVFRASTKESVLEKEGRRIYIQFGDLISPDKVDGLPSHCKEQKMFFDYDCIRSRVSVVAKGKWHKVNSCSKATLDQVAKKDYLILTNDEECLEN